MFFLTSCDSVFSNKTLPEVDFNTPKDVQLTYRQNIYNLKISYSSGAVAVYHISDNSAFDGVCYTINPDNCSVCYDDLKHNIPIDKLDDNFFPLIIYKFVTDFSGVVYTEAFNSQRACSYISRNILGNTVVLEIYEHENNVAYSLHIT